MDPNVPFLTMNGLHEVVESYLTRMDTELEEEKKRRRPGRAMSKRQEELEAVKKREAYQYEKEGLGEYFVNFCPTTSLELRAKYMSQSYQIFVVLRVQSRHGIGTMTWKEMPVTMGRFQLPATSRVPTCR